MQLHKTNAAPDSKEWAVRAITWCRKHGLAFAGLPYDAELAGPDGVSLALLVPPGTDRPIIEQALREAYREQDIVRHQVVVCPVSWFQAAKPEVLS